MRLRHSRRACIRHNLLSVPSLCPAKYLGHEPKDKDMQIPKVRLLNDEVKENFTRRTLQSRR